jgi:teichuronic acid biosynthesis protein TuaE
MSRFGESLRVPRYRSYDGLFLSAWTLVLATAFLGPSIMAVPVGPISLFPFRLILPLFVLVYAWHLWRTRTMPQFSPVARLAVVMLLLFLAYAMISVAWAPDKFLAVRNVIFIGSGIALVVITAALANTWSKLWVLSAWLFAIVTAMILVALGEYLTRLHFPISAVNSYDSYRLRTPSSFFTNPNDLATVIVLFVPLCLLYAMRKKGLGNTLLACAVAGLGLGFVFLTISSRASMLAALLELGCAVVFLRGWRPWAFIGATVTLVIVLNFTLLNQNLINSLDPTSLTLSAGTQSRLDEYRDVSQSLGSLAVVSPNSSSQVRLQMLEDGIGFLRDSHFLGVGAGNSSWYMARNPEPIVWADGIVMTDLHNWWVELLTEYGLPGFLAYMTAFTGIGFSLLLLAWQRRGTDILPLIALMGMAAFLLCVLGPSSVVALMPQWVFLGFALAVVNVSYLSLDNLEEEPIVIVHLDLGKL